MFLTLLVGNDYLPSLINMPKLPVAWHSYCLRRETPAFRDRTLFLEGVEGHGAVLDLGKESQERRRGRHRRVRESRERREEKEGERSRRRPGEV